LLANGCSNIIAQKIYMEGNKGCEGGKVRKWKLAKNVYFKIRIREYLKEEEMQHMKKKKVHKNIMN